MFKRAVYLKLQKYTYESFAPKIRELGQSIFYKGVDMTKENEHTDRLVPS